MAMRHWARRFFLKALIAVLSVLICLVIRLAGPNPDNRDTVTLAEIKEILDTWRIDVAVDSGTVDVDVIEQGARAERTPGLRRQFVDGQAITGTRRHMAARVTPTKDGPVHVFLRCEYRFAEGRSLPFCADYVSFAVNSQGNMLDGRKATSYSKPLRFDLPGKSGEPIAIEAELLEHEYGVGEVERLLGAFFNSKGKTVRNLPLALALRGCGSFGVAAYWMLEHWAFAATLLAFLVYSCAVLLFAGQHGEKLVFLGGMSLMWVIPVLLLTGETLSMTEKRRLAELPQFIVDGRPNLQFAKGLEAWFNDHFGLREDVISGYKRIVRSINSVVAMNAGRWNRNTGWFFKKTATWDLKYDEKGLAELVRFRDWLRENGVDFYLLLVPDKERVYAQEARSVGIELPTDAFQDWCDNLSKTLGNHFLCPMSELVAGKENGCVYYKTSHHWSQYGTFLAWNTLGRRLCENGQIGDLSPFRQDAYTTSTSRFVREDFSMTDAVGATASTYFGLNVQNAPRGLLDVDYTYYSPKAQFKRSKYFHEQYHCGFDYKNADGNYCRVCVMGNSQSDQMDPFLEASFANSRRIRFNATGLYKGDLNEQVKIFKHYASEIREFRPDVLILCLVEFELPRLRNLMKED